MRGDTARLAAENASLRKELEKEKENRSAERSGRIRAEQKMRLSLQQNAAANGYPLVPIGIARTCFPSRNGTPRQGGLCPHTRGFIELDKELQPTCLEKLETFSHLWVIYVFHENTNLHNVASASSKDNSTSIKSRRKKQASRAKFAKFRPRIVPPQLAGVRVGVFSTRTPHRYGLHETSLVALCHHLPNVALCLRSPNPIGLVLCRIERIESQKRRIYLSGVDLVDGTPVLDVKPYLTTVDQPLQPEVPRPWVSERRQL